MELLRFIFSDFFIYLGVLFGCIILLSIFVQFKPIEININTKDKKSNTDSSD